MVESEEVENSSLYLSIYVAALWTCLVEWKIVVWSIKLHPQPFLIGAQFLGLFHTVFMLICLHHLRLYLSSSGHPWMLSGGKKSLVVEHKMGKTLLKVTSICVCLFSFPLFSPGQKTIERRWKWFHIRVHYHNRLLNPHSTLELPAISTSMLFSKFQAPLSIQKAEKKKKRGSERLFFHGLVKSLKTK